MEKKPCGLQRTRGNSPSRSSGPGRSTSIVEHPRKKRFIASLLPTLESYFGLTWTGFKTSPDPEIFERRLNNSATLARNKRALVNNETLQLVERTIPIIMDLLSPLNLSEPKQEPSLKPNVTVTDRNQTLTNNDSQWSKEELQDLASWSLIVAICLGAALVAGIALRCFDEIQHSTEDSPLPDSASLSHSYVSIIPWRWNLSTHALPEEEHIYEVMTGGHLSSIKETP